MPRRISETLLGRFAPRARSKSLDDALSRPPTVLSDDGRPPVPVPQESPEGSPTGDADPALGTRKTKGRSRSEDFDWNIAQQDIDELERQSQRFGPRRSEPAVRRRSSLLQSIDGLRRPSWVDGVQRRLSNGLSTAASLVPARRKSSVSFAAPVLEAAPSGTAAAPSADEKVEVQ